MIGVITHHWAQAEKLQEAKTILDGNGVAQSQAPGFGTRQTMISIADPTQISTLVTWESSEVYDQWRASDARKKAMAGAELLWSRNPESERFNME
ncbi:MAG TPA: hypothetical protein DEZ08_08525 [Dehalococcoidia bacterium]|jgi:heme-degrading monooxygenase HmoA|nr:hypothetical protein [Dehalococcoidia bacterium]|tara:strand:+ start:1660 stop:1944 length:285 start_codon:yes stop_codon:yes gene_type:complete